MLLTLIPTTNPVLKTKAKAVTDPASVAGLAADLLETMVDEGGVGLAAPQVGQSLRLFVTGVDGKQTVYINPELSKPSKEQIWWEEGCLSLPRLLGQVKRPKQIRVTATGLDGRRFSMSADGLLARVLQHEYDHVDGILFPDRMEDLSSIRKLTENEWASRFDSVREQSFEVE